MRSGLTAALLAALVFLSPPLHAGPPALPEGLGMWVWTSSAFATGEARERLVRFCVRHHINHLDVQVRFSKDGPNPRVRNEEALRKLILLAGRHNITTAALRGSPRMFSARNHEWSLRELNAIIAFGESLPQKSLLKGVKYDVEPYLTREWGEKGKPLNALMHDYLLFLRKARMVLQERAPHLWLAVDTPFWWDKEEFALEFEGERKRFNEHIQDLTDFIVIMSYRSSAKQVLGVVENELRYAERIDKKIFLSLETNRLERDQKISFWGLPKEDLQETISVLLRKAKEELAIGGLMIHSYRGLAEKLDNIPPPEPDGDEPPPAVIY